MELQDPAHIHRPCALLTCRAVESKQPREGQPADAQLCGCRCEDGKPLCLGEAVGERHHVCMQGVIGRPCDGLLVVHTERRRCKHAPCDR